MPPKPTQVRPELPTEDVDILGNGMLICRTIQPGDSAKQRPQKGDLVEMEIRAILVDSVEYHKGLGMQTFRPGEGDVCDVLECVAPRMLPGEICAVRSSPAAFGLELELCQKSPPAPVEGVVRLLRVQQQTPVSERSFSERLSEAKKKKDRGNYLFGRDELQAAAVSFSIGFEFIREDCHAAAAHQKAEEENKCAASSSEDASPIPADDRTDALQLCSSLYTNLALVQLKLGSDHSKEALSTCNAALALQPRNVKAMYLRAKSLLAAEEAEVCEPAWNEAISTLEVLLNNAPDNEQAKELLASAKSKLASFREQQKANGSQLWTVVVSTIIIVVIAVFMQWNEPAQGAEGVWMRGDDIDVIDTPVG